MAKYKAKTKECQLIVKVKLSSGEKINERELDFFTRKYIRGLLKAKMVKKFGITSIEYTGPIGICLFERLKKPITKYDFLFIIEQIVDISQKVQLNSMSLNKVVWDIHNIFINETTREVQFIYLPLENIEKEADIIALIDSVVYSAKPVQEQNSDYISRFVYFMKGLSKFDAEQIEKFILQEDRNVVNTIKKHYAGQSGFMTDKPKDYYEHYACDDEKTGLLEEATGLLEDEATGLLCEEETGLLVEEEETTLLENDEQVHFPSLFRVLTEENISINKPVFRLGKEKSYADYFVSNNNAVSRSHADIITRGQRVFVIDLNSKNKTYINDQPIPVQQETEIFNGDRLRLANEEFIFYA
ncbi:MAG: FHA domain-containing protein [Lactobacillus sp.]|nr:FHA domain-containing protein [Lactobacillus sp.]